MNLQYADLDVLPRDSVLAASTVGPSVRNLLRCFEHTADQEPGRVAVEVGPARITYRHLDHRANHLAHLLRERRVSAGSTVGILLDRSEDTYVALLGVLKAGGAYVPLDASFPADRVRYIAENAGFQDLVTTSASRDVTRDLPCAVVELDLVQPDLAASELRPNCVRTGR